jgi:predicted ATPase
MNLIGSIDIKGYRPFRDFKAHLSSLEIMVGANGSGKSSMFEFLRFIRDSMSQDIPPEIVAGTIGQQVFHQPGAEKIGWSFIFSLENPQTCLTYEAELMGPVGKVAVTQESVDKLSPNDIESHNLLLFDFTEGHIDDSSIKQIPVGQGTVYTKRPNQLALANNISADQKNLIKLREIIRSWRFYSSFKLDAARIKRSAIVEQGSYLREDGSNLSAVLHNLLTEYPAQFNELQHFIGLMVPGFQTLTVKARGGPGEIMAFWQEKGAEGEFSLADLSDGIVRLLCWTVLCVHPNPPSLICIDEPDQGLHPRTLPILAGLFEKASSRTQIFLATHSSYFLTQFDLEYIAVFRKENGEACFLKPKDSLTLTQNLKDFGSDELEIMHRSDELEQLA